ncbi:LLM class flavin-dependent oxidoreductase [Rhodococcoides kyotonense]|uniref:Luciferase family oxidoreductase, group 1 n=1 Tax=Rhodococcoides kyotonense TaxID=398843 RepID=A0A239MAZ6_9NOCA|nr:LLM class flavin-dependent oxidoreductase [Rhodococcus kyotonensis]SNT39915.1 luciferase family oxidoreductase, group 1 [Rhodococcus kyotonensis]
MKLSILDQSVVPSGTTPDQTIRNTVELARAAESLGFHRFWLAEHHATGSFASPAPEILVSHIAAVTSSIRVGSGGVLLPNYSSMKVAETFRSLSSLSPTRIDLGIGRGGGGSDAAASSALRAGRHVVDSDDEFAARLSELLAFLSLARFPGGHPYEGIALQPQSAPPPDVWLLGASLASADLAGRFGLPYTFAHFGLPQLTRAAVNQYRSSFRSPDGRPPRVQIGISIFCAPTEKEAQYLFSSQRLFRARMRIGDLRPLPSPEEAFAGLRSLPDPLEFEEAEWPRCVVGTPDQVRETLVSIQDALNPDELIVLSSIHDPIAKLDSYRSLAEIFETTSTASRSSSVSA